MPTIPEFYTPIRVAAGLLTDHHGKILMGKRKASGLRPGLWELPGGKVEHGERPEAALVREWEEELDVGVPRDSVGKLLDVALIPAELTFVVELYPVRLPDAELARLRAKDHEAIDWVWPTDAVRYLPCSPAFYLQFRAVLDWSQGRIAREI